MSINASSTTHTSPPPETATTSTDPAQKLNKYSSRITEPKAQGGAQAILYGVGLSDDDLHKPQIGISSVWYEGNTCNMHLLKLAEAVKEGVKEANMVGFRFNTIGVSDAISMGTRGMCYSLQSRDLIADSIETVMSAQWYDGNISIPGCDKNVSLPFSFPLSKCWLCILSAFHFDRNVSIFANARLILISIKQQWGIEGAFVLLQILCSQTVYNLPVVFQSVGCSVICGIHHNLTAKHSLSVT